MNNLLEQNPELCKDWDYNKNIKKPNEIAPFSNKNVWWKCLENHSWEASPNSRNGNKTKCPFCFRKKISEINSLTKHQHLVNEWHYEKNFKLPKDFSEYSSHRVWWVCGKKHEWIAVISTRTAGNGCPYCSNKLACTENCLATINPELSKEWHPTKNENIKAKDVLPNSKKSVWWQCINGHEWKATISDRHSHKTKCTQCKGYTVRHQNEMFDNEGKRICKRCGVAFDDSFFRMQYDKRDKQTRYNSNCKKCSDIIIVKYRSSPKGIAAEIVRAKRSISLKKKIPFDLDAIWVFDKLNSINWKCELTDIPFVIRNEKQDRSGFMWDSLSVDRIDPKGGYTKANVRFILNMVNLFKQDQTDEVMFMVAKAMLDKKEVK